MPGLRAVILTGALVTVAACANRDIGLHNLGQNSTQPEEFAILPVKPLQEPKNFSELPTPTPGGANLTDPTPEADAVAALGGNPGALAERGVPASDSALVRQAGRYGTAPGIRRTLAAEDLDFRRRKSLFTFKIVPEDEYYDAYSGQSLDAYRVLRAYRAAGARVPSAPPEER